MSNELVTLHLGSRTPKKYFHPHELPAGEEYDPNDPKLHDQQPGFLKCRVKIRISKHSTLSQALEEIQRCWHRLDHDKVPAWISGTNDFAVQAVAMQMGIKEIRPWAPAEGDE